MKPFIFLIVVLVISLTASPQKMMLLADSLKQNSEPMQAKPKGISTLLKYEFGPYKMISAKAGFIISKTRSKLFSEIDETESKQKASFVFTAHQTDTLHVNITIIVNSKSIRELYLSIQKNRVSLEREEDPSWENVNHSVVALISLPDDTLSWKMILVTNSKRELPVKFTRTGMLTDGKTIIDIREVTRWADGSSPKLYSTTGFEFLIDSKPIGAVQHPLDTFQKKYVWLHAGTDEKIKNILAAAAAVLFNYGNPDFD